MSNNSISELNPETTICLNNVSVRYRLPSESIGTFKEYLIRLLQGQIKKKAFWALKDINLEVQKGEIFGVLGKNGAGKSTLLKVLSKVLIPVEGRVRLIGSISPLLQLGAGFHPELTGMENIYLNATLLGHPRNEVDEKLDEIVDFAEIGSFIEAPLRTYSSGMQARLGFAVASAWQPDILILDEVLAVGDLNFRMKCFKRLSKFRDSGATVIMVSHMLESILKFCTRALWLDKGEIQMLGQASEVCAAYENAAFK